jgi:hypothetical protein
VRSREWSGADKLKPFCRPTIAMIGGSTAKDQKHGPAIV